MSRALTKLDDAVTEQVEVIEAVMHCLHAISLASDAAGRTCDVTKPTTLRWLSTQLDGACAAMREALPSEGAAA